MRLQCPNCTTEFDLRPPSGGRRRARVQFRCTECGTPLGLEELSLEDDEDSPSEMPSVAGVVPELADEEEPPRTVVDGPGDLPFDPPVDPVMERFQAEMASLGTDTGPAGDGALLKQDGKVYHVRNTATIQRWIVERRVLREDLISTGGMRWEPVGGHPDLEIFFQMVERLDALEQTGNEPEHSTRPPVADADEVTGPWSDDSDPGLPMPDEEEDDESDFPSDPSSISEATGPVYIGEEVDDQDSEISALPFAIKGAETEEHAPASVSVPDIPIEPNDGLPEMRSEPVPLGEADPETAEAPAPNTPVEVDMVLPVSTGPIDEPTQEAFDEDGFFDDGERGEPTLSAPRDLRPPPVPASVEDRTLALPIIEPEKDSLAWEEDRAERRQRLMIIGAVIVVLLLGAGAWWVSQESDGPVETPSEPAVADREPEDPAANPDLAGTPDAAPQEGEPQPGEEDPATPAAEDPTPSTPAPQPVAEDPPASEATPAPKDPPAESRPARRDPPAERQPARKVPSTDAGWDAMGAGDFNGARLIFVEQVAANPGNADAHYGLGYAAQKQGDQATAIRHYCKALTLGPGNREIQQTVPSLLSSMDAACP